MLRSMTGFGAASREGAGIAASVEVRSVNHRHLQLKVRVPSELSELEPKLDALVRKRLGRGAVSVNVAVTRAAGARAIDPEAARRYHAELTGLAKELGISPAIELSALLSLPGVVAADAGAGDVARAGKVALAAAGEALDGLLAMREKEGKALTRDLGRNLGALRRVVRKVERRVPTVVRAAQEGLRKRVRALLDGADVSEADLAREIALIADRGDVSEELARLASHFDQVEGALETDGSVGRQLDFLVQELFRELNTVGSKCSDAQVAHWVVEAKTLAERLREQVQNVE